MARGEISWTRRDEEGHKCQIYAHREQGGWRFFIRQGRFENWESLEAPPLEDWLTLLDGVRRRVARRLLPPEEVAKLRRTIREEYPDASPEEI